MIGVILTSGNISHENKLRYNKIYDELYRKGATHKEMRVSSVHHETSIKALLQVQEIEPKTWAKITQRHQGINTVKHLKKDFYKCPDNYPEMFDSWKDYAMHLAKNLITEKENYDKLIKKLEPQMFLDNEITGKDSGTLSLIQYCLMIWTLQN